MRTVVWFRGSVKPPSERDLLHRAGADRPDRPRDAVRPQATCAGKHRELLERAPHAALQRVRAPGPGGTAERATRANGPPPPHVPAHRARPSGARALALGAHGRARAGARPGDAEAVPRRRSTSRSTPASCPTPRAAGAWRSRWASATSASSFASGRGWRPSRGAGARRLGPAETGQSERLLGIAKASEVGDPPARNLQR
jgi:hypothetical protein